MASQQRARRGGWLGGAVTGAALDAAVGGSGLGRLSRPRAGSHRRHHHCRCDPDRARPRTSRSGDPQLEELDGRPAELAAAEARARSRVRQRHADAPEEPRPAAGPGNGSVTPPGSTKLVVQDASFTLSKGQGLGIIGPSASGKSSLARLLVGVWTPVRGKVRLDGAALDQWSAEVLGRHIGYLPQAVKLLPGTISDNIARFEAEADPEAVIRAAEAAGVHDLIVTLADGYQAMIPRLPVVAGVGSRPL